MKYLVLTVLLAVIQTSIPVPRKTTNSSSNASNGIQGQTTSDKTPTAQPQTPVNAHEAPKHDAARSEQESENTQHSINVTKLPTVSVEPDWGMWFFSLLLVAVGSIQAWLLYRTWGQIERQAGIMDGQLTAMQRQAGVMERQELKLAESVEVANKAAIAAQTSADSAKQNVELIISRERARLRIIGKPKDLILAANALTVIKFNLGFTGFTPAFSVSSEIDAVVSPSEESPESYLPHRIPDLPTIVAAEDIKPIYNCAIMRPLSLDEATLEAIKRRRLFVHFWGFIKYLDAFDRPRETTFRYRWRPADPTSRPRPFLIEYWEEYGKPEDNNQT